MIEEKVTIANEKGLKLVGVLHLPTGRKRCPAVINLHGFTGYKEEENSSSLARDLASKGYVVIRFDASGDGESEGTLSDDYRMTNYLSDIDSVYQYLIHHPCVDPEKIGVWGHSMGATLSLIWGSMHNEIKVICAVSPPIELGSTDWLGPRLESWKRTGWFSKISSNGNIEKRIPWAFVEDARKYNVLKFVQGVKSPTMIVLGLSDDTVPPEQSRKIYRRLTCKKELIEVEGMSHDYKKFPDQVLKVNEKVLPFFRQFL
ncbi:alpha/beta fold hydrolase [Candidatus Gottesmanbacteria bacterium]|nr:alpha/beta fold hydrolase [Candidatus Gottesmanbacteria bacterium]